MSPLVLDTLEKQIHSYPLHFLNIDFPTLIGTSTAIETMVIADVKNHIYSSITALEKVSRASPTAFLLEDVPHEMISSWGVNSRSLVVIFQPLGGSQAENKGKYASQRIDGFGFIDQIELHGPPELQEEMSLVCEEAARILRAAYIALEESFVTKYLEWRFSIFDTIYSLTNTHLKILGDVGLVGRYWFSVTNLKETKFRYQFDRTAIERAIAWFKDNSGSSASPFSSLSFLLVEDANDAVFGSEKFDFQPERVSDEVVILPFNRLPHFQVGMTDFWVAERQLYGEDAMACIDVVTFDDLSLQMNCPQKDMERYRIALAASKADIKSIFEANKKKYLKDLRSMNVALDRLRNSGSFVREVTTDIVAKYAAELTKSGQPF